VDGVADGSLGVAVAGVEPDVPVAAGVAVAAPLVPAGAAEALVLAGDADALADAAVSLLDAGAEAEAPLIDAAKAVRCVRTSCSLVRADSSSVIDAELLLPVVVFGAVAVEPDVPAVADAPAPVALSAPSNSEMIRSAAATSLLQFALDFADAPDDFEADCSSALICFFSSATRVFVVPVNEAAGISPRADCARRRCSFADPCFVSAPGVRPDCAGAVVC
jgi:hypothetical protein